MTDEVRDMLQPSFNHTSVQTALVQFKEFCLWVSFSFLGRNPSPLIELGYFVPDYIVFWSLCRNRLNCTRTVEASMASSAQRRAFQPVKHEQSPFTASQLLKREGRLVLPPARRQLLQHR